MGPMLVVTSIICGCVGGLLMAPLGVVPAVLGAIALANVAVLTEAICFGGAAVAAKRERKAEALPAGVVWC